MKNNSLNIAYFCMEFGLHEDFQIYSGGLGILAGDVLKAAKDDNYSIVGVGILWRQGYTNQKIDENGIPYDIYYENKYKFLKDTNISVAVEIRGRSVVCKVWECTEFNNVPLYLLDVNIEENDDNLLTGQLYGWFSEERVAQEMILSIGGVRALKKLGIDIDIYHFNDSHPVLAGIELICKKMDEDSLDFDDAWGKVRKKIVFTTHTPVVAGNEVHEHNLLEYMGMYNGLNYKQMVKIGGDPFSMTAAGLRLSKISNAVSQLHGKTAKEMWKDVDKASNIIGITNGVHNGTWQDIDIISSYNKKAGLLEVHQKLKKELFTEIEKRNNVLLDNNILTIGFARRFASYKRSNLIFNDMNILEPLLKSKKIQLVFSGKAHPNDLTGKGIVSDIYRISKKYNESLVFIQNYDMKIGKLLTRGCDVWLNNPIRTMEASGTSGIKSAMNGVLNFSVLDGWWPEGAEHGINGWNIGNGYEGKDHKDVDSKSLYKVLIEEIIPTYENKTKWEDMMKNSIEMSKYKFSAKRMLEDYYDLLYCSIL